MNFAVDLHQLYPSASFVWINKELPRARIPIKWKFQLLSGCDGFVSSLVQQSTRINEVNLDTSEHQRRPWYVFMQPVQPLSTVKLVSLSVLLLYSNNTFEHGTGNGSSCISSLRDVEMQRWKEMAGETEYRSIVSGANLLCARKCSEIRATDQCSTCSLSVRWFPPAHS